MKPITQYIELRYLTEAVKPPRLSRHNKDIWKGASEEAIRLWLKENCKVYGKVEIVDGKINVKGDVVVKDDVKEFPYPFGEVTGSFDCSSCNNLTSLEGAPKEVGSDFNCRDCGKQFTEDDVREVCKVGKNINLS